MMRVPRAFLAVLAFLLAGTTTVLAQEENGQLLRIIGHGETITWEDQNAEMGYRVSGTIRYWAPPSCFQTSDFPAELVTFSEELPADTTHFQLPRPQDKRLTYRKEMHVTIEAVGADASVLARNGFAFTSDPFIDCTIEGIAAAGTGLHQTSSSRLLMAAIALVSFGTVSLFSSLITMRKRT